MNKRKRNDNKLYAVTRKQAFERDGGCCVICGSSWGLQCHHIVFRSQGGLSDLRNLACLCMQCHNQAHGVFAKEIRKHLLEEVEKRTDEYERISND